MNTDTKRWGPDMADIELQCHNAMTEDMEPVEKSLKELAEVVKSIKNSTVKGSGDTETK